MRFGVFLPPQAASGRVPVLYWLSGLTCTEENFIVKAGAWSGLGVTRAEVVLRGGGAGAGGGGGVWCGGGGAGDGPGGAGHAGGGPQLSLRWRRRLRPRRDAGAVTNRRSALLSSYSHF